MARGCIARMGNSGCAGHGEQHAGEILSRTYVTVCVTSWLLAASLVGGILHKRRVDKTHLLDTGVLREAERGEKER